MSGRVSRQALAEYMLAWTSHDRRSFSVSKVVSGSKPPARSLRFLQRPGSHCAARSSILSLTSPIGTTLPSGVLETAGHLRLTCSLSTPEDSLRHGIEWPDTQNWHEAVSRIESAAKDHSSPLVVDPFAGGGSIPLEALRVGADAFASDLNPVAVLLNKVTLEYIPKYGQRLADEVRKWGEWIKCEAEKELAEFYPKGRGSANTNCLSLGTDDSMRRPRMRRRSAAYPLALVSQESQPFRSSAILAER